MSAIIDSNVTTVLTALFLFQFGTGPVKGFAVTLILGIAASMVTAIFVTRTFFMIWLDRQPDHGHPEHLTHETLRQRQLRLPRQRRIAYGITAAASSCIGLLVLVIRGVNYSVEFTGGTLVQVQTTKAVDVAALRSALQARGIDDAEIQNFGSDREYRDAGPGRASRARTPTTPRPRPAPSGEALDADARRGQLHRSSAPRRSAPRWAASSASRPSSRSCCRSSRCWPTWPTGSSGGSASRRSSPRRTTSSPRSPSSGSLRLEVSLFVVAGAAHDGGLLAQRHDHHLRPGPGEPAQAQAGQLRERPQPVDQRDPAAEHSSPARPRWAAWSP